MFGSGRGLKEKIQVCSSQFLNFPKALSARDNGIANRSHDNGKSHNDQN